MEHVHGMHPNQGQLAGVVRGVRSRWRRTMSLVLNRTQFIAFSQIPLLRLSLHPVDAMA